MKTKIEKEVRILKIYAITTTIVFSFLILTSFISQNKNQKFEEIDVERINIIEKNGELKMVISNKTRQHPGIVNGKMIKREYQRPAGIIFFNQIGDEMGGLVYGENGENGHFGSLTWDKFKGDQTIGFRHLEGSNGKYSSGLSIWQQPDITGDIIAEKIDSINSNIKDASLRKVAFQKMKDDNLLATSRMFLGKSRNDASLLIMNDKNGKERIIMKVDVEGKPKLEFLNETGEIIYSIPEK
jgi:hypothetical protein